MGLFKQSVQVSSVDGQQNQTIEAWVDTGSSYTWLPADVLRSLGFEPTEERQFILANGQRETRPVAQARISPGGPSFFTYCAFAAPEEELLIGAIALEEAGLAVDPVNRRLVPAASYALTAILRGRLLDPPERTPGPAGRAMTS